jgi:hypothetical protein
MKKYNISILITAIFILLSINVYAQEDAIFKIEVPDSVPPNTLFQVTFVLENAKGAGFTPPDWNNFERVSGPRQSSSFTMINGVTSQKISYTYFLKTDKEGTFTINPATIHVDNKALKTDWKKVAVVENYVMPRIEQKRKSIFDNWESFPQERRPTPTVPKKKLKRTNKKTYRI